MTSHAEDIMPRINHSSQNTPQVHYLGPPASFSHQASLNAFQPHHRPSKSTSTSILPSFIPQPSFAEIFTAVQSSSFSSQPPPKSDAHPDGTTGTAATTYGVVPFENSSNGSVVQLLDLLADHNDAYPDVTVCGEYYLPVHHCLLVQRIPPLHSDHLRHEIDSRIPNGDHTNGNETSTDPTTSSFDISHITQILTHPQVWGQCTSFLSHPSLKSTERIDVGSTSLAAQKVAQQQQLRDGEGITAAIASNLAASLHGLEVVASNIEDHGNNTTRFFILRNSRSTTLDLWDPETRESDGEESNGGDLATTKPTSKQKSLLSFTINHTAPGSLADALAVFGTQRFNLTSIYTRPSRLRPWHYIFFVECARIGGEEGRGEVGDGMVELVGELEKHTTRLRVLGTWRDRGSIGSSYEV